MVLGADYSPALQGASGSAPVTHTRVALDVASLDFVLAARLMPFCREEGPGSSHSDRRYRDCLEEMRGHPL